MQNSSSVDMANVNVKKVAQGMMRVVDSLDSLLKLRSMLYSQQYLTVCI